MTYCTLLLCTALLALNLVKAGTPMSDFLEVITQHLFQSGDDQCNCERCLSLSGEGSLSFLRNESVIILSEVSQSYSGGPAHEDKVAISKGSQ